MCVFIYIELLLFVFLCYLYIQCYHINYIHIYLIIKVYVSLHDCLSMEKYVDIKKYTIGKLLLIY